jgi:hypothetical protein
MKKCKMKEIKYIILYLVLVPETINNYGSGSGSDFLTSYGSGSTSQKVTVSTVPVPQRCLWDSWLARLSASLARFSCRCLEQSEGSTSGRKSLMCEIIIRMAKFNLSKLTK